MLVSPMVEGEETTIRLKPRVKLYLDELASMHDSTIAEVLNDVILLHLQESGKIETPTLITQLEKERLARTIQSYEVTKDSE